MFLMDVCGLPSIFEFQSGFTRIQMYNLQCTCVMTVELQYMWISVTEFLLRCHRTQSNEG